MATTVGLLHLELHVVQASSLKDKRQVIKSFKDRLANRFNVSVAEVDRLDNHRYAVLAVAMVSNDKQYIEGALQQIVRLASTHRDMLLANSNVEWL
jgi:uncharacterized protein